ncbi:hypothetical protein M0R04_14725 [Candidatus Dojkabacteria bacterium]|jgi:hypothetical protein|nr:hypothetical protein [Candidatus Dojkabacteria bacterium]
MELTREAKSKLKKIKMMLDLDTDSEVFERLIKDFDLDTWGAYNGN